MKRHILRDYKNFPSQVFGLVSAKSFTQLAWALREYLHLRFVRDEDISLVIDGATHYWPRFTYHDPESETMYSLIKNKSVDGLLAPELKNVDVFLVEMNQNLTFQLNLDNISEINFVHFCFEIETNMIKHETQHLLHE